MLADAPRPVADPLPTLSQLSRPYRCPGQRDGVSETVHQARLAAGDPRCVGCRHRPTDGDRQLRQPLLDPSQPGSLRGRLHRELTVDQVRRFMDRLGRQLSHRRNGPVLAVGQDDRATSAVLAGTVEAFRRHGGRTIDVGTVLRPTFDFAVRWLDADAGVLFTAGSRPNGWAGLDLVDADATPSVLAGELAIPSTDPRTASGSGRLSRRSGAEEAIDPHPAYLASLSRLIPRDRDRPLRLAISVSSEQLTTIVRRLLAKTAVEIVSVRRGDRFDLAVRLSPDGRRLAVADERGEAIPPATLLSAAEPFWQADGINDETIATDRLGRVLAAARSLDGAVGEPAALEWIGEGRSSQDALLTLALLLQAVGQSQDRPSLTIRSLAASRLSTIGR